MTEPGPTTDDPRERRSGPVSSVAADPRVLRAIAHPVRNRILGELEASGPLRAADVAALVGVPANQASFHLRQLAKYGVVEPAPELARDRRDRVWRLVGDQLEVNVSEIEKAPGGPAAAAVWRRHATAEMHALVERAYAPSHEGKPPGSMLQASMRLTPEEVRELGREINDLATRWNARTREAGPQEGAASYVFLTLIEPYADGEPRES